MLVIICQAISCDDWGDREPFQEEEDLWDDARLEVPQQHIIFIVFIDIEQF